MKLVIVIEGRDDKTVETAFAALYTSPMDNDGKAIYSARQMVLRVIGRMVERDIERGEALIRHKAADANQPASPIVTVEESL